METMIQQGNSAKEYQANSNYPPVAIPTILNDRNWKMFPKNLTLDEMSEHLIFITNGSLVAYCDDNTSIFLSLNDFRNLYQGNKIIDLDKGIKKPTPVSSLWLGSENRKSVMTRTFKAGGGVICEDPSGLKSVNIWRPIKRKLVTVDISPFLEHIDYLFSNPVEKDVFLDWLAHIEQRPSELPHYGWLHIAKQTGCGRNWLASVLNRVWKGYVAPNVDLPALLDSQFNSVLSSKVLIIVDEIQEGTENSFRHKNRLKSLVNTERRMINPKCSTQYDEHNSGRWLVFSNHENALALDDTDRRWRVIFHKEKPREPEAYEKLYRLLENQDFINSIGVYLKNRDISNFKPGERPPLNEAKQTVINATKTPVLKNAEDMKERWLSDILIQSDVIDLLSDGSGTEMNAHMRRTMTSIGAIQTKKIKYKGKPEKCWIIRNHQKWMEILNIDLDKIKDEVSRARKDSQRNWSASLVISDSIVI